MQTKTALITYYAILVLGYVWAFVQLGASEPFDAFVLFIITFSFQSYRNSVKELLNDN